MPTKKSQGRVLFEDAIQLRSDFDFVLFLFENESIEFAVTLAQKTLEKINGFEKGFLSQTLNPISKRLMEDPDQHERKSLHNDLLLIQNALDSLVDNIQTKHKIGNPLLWKVKKARKKILFGVAVAIALSLSIKMGREFIRSPNGLMAEYYSDKGLKNLVHKKQVSEIDFNWKDEAPIENFQSDLFSIRFTGYLKVENSGNYTFSTISDDGVKVWIGDKLIIKNWTRHKAEEDVAELTLIAGLHKVKVEYFENYKLAQLRLFWKHQNDPVKQIIPNKNLFIKKIKY